MAGGRGRWLRGPWGRAGPRIDRPRARGNRQPPLLSSALATPAGVTTDTARLVPTLTGSLGRLAASIRRRVALRRGEGGGATPTPAHPAAADPASRSDVARVLSGRPRRRRPATPHVSRPAAAPTQLAALLAAARRLTAREGGGGGPEAAAAPSPLPPPRSPTPPLLPAATHTASLSLADRVAAANALFAGVLGGSSAPAPTPPRPRSRPARSSRPARDPLKARSPPAAAKRAGAATAPLAPRRLATAARADRDTAAGALLSGVSGRRAPGGAVAATAAALRRTRAAAVRKPRRGGGGGPKAAPPRGARR